MFIVKFHINTIRYTISLYGFKMELIKIDPVNNVMAIEKNSYLVEFIKTKKILNSMTL